MLTAMTQWERSLLGEQKSSLEAIFPSVLMTRRWFGGKARKIQAVRILESVPFSAGVVGALFLFLRVEYQEGHPETYVMPVLAAFGGKATQIQHEMPHAVVASFAFQGEDGVLYEAVWDTKYSTALLLAIGQEGRFQGDTGILIASSTEAFPDLVQREDNLTPVLMKAEQSNTSIAYEERVILKLYRRLQDGLNPDLEIGRVLTAMNFVNSPRVGGAIEYSRLEGQPATVAILQEFVKNQGDAWKVTLEAFERFLQRCRTQPIGHDGAYLPATPLWQLADKDPPTLAREAIGSYLESAELLGRRTADLHVALASCTDNPAFKPEPMSMAYRHDRYESLGRLTEQTLALLKSRLYDLPSAAKPDAHDVLRAESEIIDCFHAFRELDSAALRIRCHGDYHLGQVLWTGADFIIVDFEGEPARPLSERRLKHPPLMDVAGMLRSFHYVPYAALMGQQSDPHGTASGKSLDPSIKFWYRWVSAQFLKGYKRVAEQAPFSPRSDNEVQILLHAYLLEKAVYELRYELNNRPEWSSIPLRGIVEIIKQAND